MSGKTTKGGTRRRKHTSNSRIINKIKSILTVSLGKCQLEIASTMINNPFHGPLYSIAD